MKRRAVIYSIFLIVTIIVLGVTLVDANPQRATQPTTPSGSFPTPMVIPESLAGQSQETVITLTAEKNPRKQRQGTVRHPNGGIVVLHLDADAKAADRQAKEWTKANRPGATVWVSPSQEDFEQHIPAEALRDGK